MIRSASPIQSAPAVLPRPNARKKRDWLPTLVKVAILAMGIIFSPTQVMSEAIPSVPSAEVERECFVAHSFRMSAPYNQPEDLEQAEEMARNLKNVASQSMALCHVADQWSKKGELIRAMALIRSAPELRVLSGAMGNFAEYDIRSYYMQGVALHAIEAGRMDLALEAVTDIAQDFRTAKVPPEAYPYWFRTVSIRDLVLAQLG